MKYILNLILIMSLVSCGVSKANCDAYGDNLDKEINEYEEKV